MPGCLGAGLLLAGLLSALVAAVPESGRREVSVRDHGAVGDGRRLDTAAIQEAIDACAAGGGGQVRFPPGRYLSGTIRLRSHVALWLDAAATLIGTTNLHEYRQPTPPDFLPEAKWGKWHRALLLGEGVEDVVLAGAGTIDGNRVFDPTGEERMRGPHTLVFVNCRRFALRDLTFADSANYAVFFQVSEDVEVQNVRFVGGWDGIHFRGAPDRACRNVTITGCRFYTGDDAIAGRYWDNVVISDCILNSSCNGLRLIGPATRLLVHDCLFYGPGLQPHRTSDRHNMLSGIILQPGAWDATRGTLDDVVISDITMHRVASPFTLWIQEGNTAGRITVDGLRATGVYRSAMSVESWAVAPVTNVLFRNVRVEFDGGGAADQARSAVRKPGVDARPLPAWGFYARNAGSITLEDVWLRCAREDMRSALLAEKVQQLDLEGLHVPRVEGVDQPLVVTNVARLRVRNTEWLGNPEPPRGGR